MPGDLCQSSTLVESLEMLTGMFGPIVFEAKVLHLSSSFVAPLATMGRSGMDPDAQRMASEDQIRQSSVKKFAFNAHRSAKIPLRRPLRDMRSQQCQAQLYVRNHNHLLQRMGVAVLACLAA